MHIAKFPGVTTFNAADVFTLKYCLIESGRSFVISFVEKTTGVPASLLPRPGAMDAPISLSTVVESKHGVDRESSPSKTRRDIE